MIPTKEIRKENIQKLSLAISMYEKAKTEAARPERLEQIIQELKQEQVDLINSI